MTDPEEWSTYLGPWTPTELAETAQSASGIGADATFAGPNRFKSGVTKVVQARRSEDSHRTDPQLPAIFLLHATPPESASGFAPRRINTLHTGLYPLSGRLWFVGQVPASGHYIDVTGDDDQAIFALVTDTLGLGTTPAVLFHPGMQIPQLRYFPNGLIDPDSYEDVLLKGTNINIDRILNEVDRIHDRWLKTPSANFAAGKIWMDASKRWPAKNAEDIVQLYVGVGLQGAFPTCIVRPEQPTGVGRSDIEIEERDPSRPGQIIRHAILELKVLRSYGSTGIRESHQATLDWIESGVAQAHAYRQEKGSAAAALCCFDLRVEDTGDECFGHVSTMALTYSVHLKRWYVYPTSKRCRDRLIKSNRVKVQSASPRVRAARPAGPKNASIGRIPRRRRATRPRAQVPR
jgi:hypothetical protein